MRQDFADVYIAPARRGSSSMEDRCRKGRAPRNPDDLPRFEGIQEVRRRGWDMKERSCAWHVFDRWLMSQAGRPWNDVWSEICQVSDSRSSARRKLREDALRHVEIHTRREADGRIVERHDGRDVSGLHVDPDGILRWAPVRSRHARRVDAPRPTTAVDLDGMRGLRCVDGLWYEVSYGVRSRDRIATADAVGNPKTVFGDEYVLVGDRKVFLRACLGSEWWAVTAGGMVAWSKRALSAKELKAYGLANGTAKPVFRRRRGERH